MFYTHMHQIFPYTFIHTIFKWSTTALPINGPLPKKSSACPKSPEQAPVQKGTARTSAVQQDALFFWDALMQPPALHPAPKRKTAYPCPSCLSSATEPMDAHVREGQTIVQWQCQQCAHLWEPKPQKTVKP